MATQTTVTCGLPSLFSVVRWASGPVATRVWTDPGIVMVLPPHVMKSDGYRENLGFCRDSVRSNIRTLRGRLPAVADSGRPRTSGRPRILRLYANIFT